MSIVGFSYVCHLVQFRFVSQHLYKWFAMCAVKEEESWRMWVSEHFGKGRNTFPCQCVQRWRGKVPLSLCKWAMNHRGFNCMSVSLYRRTLLFTAVMNNCLCFIWVIRSHFISLKNPQTLYFLHSLFRCFDELNVWEIVSTHKTRISQLNW